MQLLGKRALAQRLNLSSICLALVYLTNDQRIRLGLQSYGSDVPYEVVQAAKAALGSDDPLSTAKPATKKRARTIKGEFQGDNPVTPVVDEAWVDGGA